MRLTVISFGCFRACFSRSSDAILVLLIDKSSDGPISSNSIFGIFVSDFL